MMEGVGDRMQAQCKFRKHKEHAGGHEGSKENSEVQLNVRGVLHISKLNGHSGVGDSNAGYFHSAAFQTLAHIQILRLESS